MAAIVAEALTVPLEPSFVPFGLFCMTAVADLESLMGAKKIEGGVWYRMTGVLNAVPWGGGVECGGLYTRSEYGTREAGTTVIIRSGVSTAAVRDIRNHPEGKDREAKKTQSAKVRPVVCINRHRGQGRTRRKGVPAQDAITRRILACPMQVIGD
jgi:hypothetical protein